MEWRIRITIVCDGMTLLRAKSINLLSSQGPHAAAHSHTHMHKIKSKIAVCLCLTVQYPMFRVAQLHLPNQGSLGKVTQQYLPSKGSLAEAKTNTT